MIDQKRTSPTNPGADGVRIGAVTYLNSKPLIEGLADFASEASLILDYPSRLADGLARGQLDVALVPSIESVADPDYEIVSDACVAARGAVLSVKLYFRTAPARVRTLALDEGSRTSAALARLMLAERYGVHPQIEPLRLEQDTTATAADAVLLIGDRAIEPPAESFRHVWDLGEEWLAWTGLPFVFALWVTRRGSALGRAEAGLAAARDRGLRDIHDIARRESKLMRLPLETVDDYLRHRLHFTLGSAERSGLRLYLNLAAKLGLAPERRQPRFRETSPAARGNAAASARRERAEPVAR